MLRKDRVLEALRILCKKPAQDSVLRRSAGFSAEEVAEQAHIDRTNASRDLNSLAQEGRVERIPGRPVLFLIKESTLHRTLEKEALAMAAESGRPERKDAEMASPVKSGSLTISDNIDTGHLRNSKKPASVTASLQRGAIVTDFETLIGANEGLKVAIQQAKAAMLYPPHGLHTLLCGPSGVGKTTFARLMHDFALKQQALADGAPFISFNCADYAGNPQLLMGHLFGVLKGAYTGADRDRIGLVEQANHGILFLDEVHRLPPEGQEMLFYLMDRERFRRMGEVEERTSSVLLLAATTENPALTLLPTFRRRIPMTITLPGLNERTMEERHELVRAFFTTECSSIDTNIHVAPQVMRALLLYECPGNIGQLRTDVQLSCARAYLEYRTNNLPEMYVHVGVVPDHVRQGLLRTAEMHRSLSSIQLLLDITHIFTPTGLNVDNLPASARDLYTLIGDDLTMLRQGGLPDNEISRLLHLDIQHYFQRFADEVTLERQESSALLVDEQITVICREVVEYAEGQLGRTLPEKLSLVLSMHMASIMDQLARGQQAPEAVIQSMRHTYPIEYEVARVALSHMRATLNVSLPESEVDVLTILFAMADSLLSSEQARVGIVVAAHGRGVASGLAELANTLVGVNFVRWVELTLEQPPEELLGAVTHHVRLADQGSGVLLFVDFVSLLSLGEMVSRQIGGQVQTISNVSAFLVVESARRAQQASHMTVEQLATSLLDPRVQEGGQTSGTRANVQSSHANNWVFDESTGDIPGVLPATPRVILSICLTGFGSALKIAELLEAQLPDLYNQGVEILCIDVNISGKTDAEIQRLVGNRQVVAIIGTINPHLSNYPFIGLTEFLFGDGVARLRTLLGETLIDPALLLPTANNTLTGVLPFGPSGVTTTFQRREELMREIAHTLGQRMLFLNAELALPLVLRMIELIEVEVGESFEIDVLAGLMLHLACIMERGVQHMSILVGETVRAQVEHQFPRDLSICRHALQILSEQITRPLPDEEAYNIVGILRQVDIFTVDEHRFKA